MGISLAGLHYFAGNCGLSLGDLSQKSFDLR